MVCEKCREGRHTLCRLGNWCDCQHRFTPQELIEEQALRELTVLAQEMDTDPPKGHVCSRECNHGRPDL